MAELQQLLDTKKKELVRELREGGAADAVIADAPSAENPITDNSVSAAASTATKFLHLIFHHIM